MARPGEYFLKDSDIEKGGMYSMKNDVSNQSWKCCKSTTYILLKKPFGFAVRFREDALEDHFLVFAFFDGLVDQRLHEAFLFLIGQR